MLRAALQKQFQKQQPNRNTEQGRTQHTKGQTTADAAAQAKRAHADNNESTANQQGRSKRNGQTEYVQQRQASSRRTNQIKNNYPHPQAPPARVESWPWARREPRMTLAGDLWGCKRWGVHMQTVG